MEHTLVLEVPEEVYEPLAETARRIGLTPEKLATEWLTNAVRGASDDPVEAFIGAFASNMSEWADRHDELTGDDLARQMHEGTEGQ